MFFIDAEAGTEISIYNGDIPRFILFVAKVNDASAHMTAIDMATGMRFYFEMHHGDDPVNFNAEITFSRRRKNGSIRRRICFNADKEITIKNLQPSARERTEILDKYAS